MSAARDIRIDPTASGLRFNAVSAGYGAEDIVLGIDLDIRRGEFIGVVGPNGAGKSTLLRSVTREAEISSGTVQICGVSLDDLDPRHRARLAGVVPQALPILFAFSAREFVSMGRHARLGRFEHPGSADETAVERAMELTDTARLADERVDELSGGDLQRLTLAQALAQEPHVLLLDEPTSHLDLNHRLQVLDVVKMLTTEGMSVLAVFHDLDLAARYSDRIAVVSKGRMTAVGPPVEVITTEMLKSVFAVRAVVGTEVITGGVSVTPVVRDEVAEATGGSTVFVLGGSGAGADLMRRLSLAGINVTAGALNEGDIDQSVAAALGVRHVTLAPFDQMDSEDEIRVRDLAADAELVVICDVPFGGSNVGNLRAVIDADRKTVIIGDSDSERRDFTSGEATELMKRALAEGATRVASIEDAHRTICEHLGRDLTS